MIYWALSFVIMISGVGCHSEKEIKTFSSDQYEMVVERAIHSLITNEPDEFKSLMSPALIARTDRELGDGASDKIIRESYIPFFSDYAKLDPGITSMATTDSDGNRGLAYFRVFLTNDGEQRSFAVYIIDEKGALRVGNLIINKTYREITEALANH